MPSNILIMPLDLQRISILALILPFLQPPFSTGLVAKPGCPDRCGELKIPYPFGVGLNCSFDPSFDITCNNSTVSPKAYLSVIDKEVIEINDTYIRVKYPNLVSVCYDLSGATGMNVTAKSYKQSTTVDLSGTPYRLSSENALTAIGCDDMVLQSNGSRVSGGCSAFCADISGGVGYCPYGATLGNGCCQADITGDGSSDLLGAELIDLSRNLQRRKLFPCSYAFIREVINNNPSAIFPNPLNESIFSYPLYYLDNSTAFFNDNWLSTTAPPVVRLTWSLGSKNCSQAKLNACPDNKKSVCADNGDNYIFWEIRGYLCRCMEGYEGNPYLPQGCKAISITNSNAKSGCPDQCGELSIPFPFGVGPNCYREPSFEIICNASTNPPTAYLVILKAKIIELNLSRVLVNYPNLVGRTCYNLSDNQHGITKTEEHSLIINLSGTQYSVSDENSMNAMGCDDMAVGNIVGGDNRRFIGSSCASACWERQVDSQYPGTCPYASDINYYNTGYGCCAAPIPRGTTYLEANLSDLSGQRQRSKYFSCSYVFVNYKNRFAMGFPLDFLNNPTAMQTRMQQQLTGQLMLDWRIGPKNCDEAKQNVTNFACHNNSKCVDFDTKVGGYLCNCLEGYQGNPYLSSGCNDIDECTDNKTYPCGSHSTCINTPGSFKCLCPKGYYGDGKKDGVGCIYRPQAKTKTIIMIGKNNVSMLN